MKKQLLKPKVTPNCFEGYDSRIGRRRGNSTRQIDLAIDLLFTHGEVIIDDHYGHSFECHSERGGYLAAKNRADKFLFNRVLKRIDSEHNGLEMIIDHRKFIIKLKTLA